MESNQVAETPIYQLKVSLKGFIPSIWRKFQVAGNITLYRLHVILQTIMGWGNYHLYQFIIEGIVYGEPAHTTWLEVKDAHEVNLSQVVQSEGSKFIYIYDLADDWQHVLKVEQIRPPEPGAYYPICLAGERACPPEETGGIWEYNHLLEIIQDMQHKEHAEVMEWLGSKFDPDAFNLERVNRALRGVR